LYLFLENQLDMNCNTTGSSQLSYRLPTIF